MYFYIVLDLSVSSIVLINMMLGAKEEDIYIDERSYELIYNLIFLNIILLFFTLIFDTSLLKPPTLFQQ